MEPEEFNRYKGYCEYDVKGLIGKMISSSLVGLVGQEFFSKLLGAQVRVMLSCDSVKSYFCYFHCKRCAYNTICNRLPEDILLSDGCFCSLMGLDGMCSFSVVKQVYPTEELENFHKTLFEVNQSYFEYDNEKIDLMKFLINLEYLKYNNENKK